MGCSSCNHHVTPCPARRSAGAVGTGRRASKLWCRTGSLSADDLG